MELSDYTFCVWLPGNWVVSLDEEGVAQRERRSLNWTDMLHTVIDNYHSALWVGIIESLQESLELLFYQTGRNYSITRQVETTLLPGNKNYSITRQVETTLLPDLQGLLYYQTGRNYSITRQ